MTSFTITFFVFPFRPKAVSAGEALIYGWIICVCLHPKGYQRTRLCTLCKWSARALFYLAPQKCPRRFTKSLIIHAHFHKPTKSGYHEGAPGPIGSNIRCIVLPKGTWPIGPWTNNLSIYNQIQVSHTGPDHDHCAYDWAEQGNK